MSTAINVERTLEQLGDLLPLSIKALESMTVKDIVKDIAKVLGIKKAYRMRKAELVQACWSELERIRDRVAAAQGVGETAQKTFRHLKKNPAYQIPIADVAEQVYKRLRDVAMTESAFEEKQKVINGIVATVARSELDEYQFSTVKTRRRDIEKALLLLLDSEELLLQGTMKILITCFYNQLLSFQRTDCVELNKKYRKSVHEKNCKKTHLQIFGLVEDCQKTLNALDAGDKPHWTRVSIAIALGTGRRMAEVHALGSFEVTGEFELYFSGQAKTRGAEDSNTEYKIPTIFPASQLKKALAYLEEAGRRIPAIDQLKSRTATNRAFGTSLSRAVAKYKGITYKALRAIYAEVQWLSLPPEISNDVAMPVKYSQWLGHVAGENTQNTTFLSYMIYRITDWEEVKELLR